MSNQAALSKETSLKFSLFSLGFVFIVILFHSDFRYFYPFIEDLTAVSTSFFFCVSAFFFYNGLEKENIAARLKKRVVTLLLPYLLWNFIYLLLHIKFATLTIPYILRGFTVSPLCTPSWYLLTLFLFLLLSPIVMKALQKSGSTVFLLLAGMGISYLGYLRFQAELASVPVVGGYLIRMTEYVTPYLIGALIGYKFSKKLSVTWKHCVVGILCCGIILGLLLCDIPLELRFCLWVILPIALWEAIPEKIFKHLHFIRIFTGPAFWINMTHCYLLSVWANILVKVQLNMNIYGVAVQVALTVITAYILYFLLKLILPKVLQILTGNRIHT